MEYLLPDLQRAGAPALGLLAGVVLIGTALFEAFEMILLPRRASGRLGVARFFYILTWRPYSAIARRLKNTSRRESLLSLYGPSFLLLLVGVWAALLVLGFAMLHCAVGSVSGGTQDAGFGTMLYFSGATFFTLGLGDVVPASATSRLLTVSEAGTGFAFLALLIGYLPIVYQMLAHREINVSLLDQRAGSPPTAAELLRRNMTGGDASQLIALLRDWEVWAGELLESHLSYPALAYFHSRHEDQSWIAALALILDVSACVLACGLNGAAWQAGFTFAVARHAVGDLTNVLSLRPTRSKTDRLDRCSSRRLFEIASMSGLLSEQPGPAGSEEQRLRD
jgi:Ion channel